MKTKRNMTTKKSSKTRSTVQVDNPNRVGQLDPQELRDPRLGYVQEGKRSLKPTAPVEAIHGVGPRTAANLHKQQIYTVGDLTGKSKKGKKIEDPAPPAQPQTKTKSEDQKEKKQRKSKAPTQTSLPTPPPTYLERLRSDPRNSQFLARYKKEIKNYSPTEQAEVRQLVGEQEWGRIMGSPKTEDKEKEPKQERTSPLVAKNPFYQKLISDADSYLKANDARVVERRFGDNVTDSDVSGTLKVLRNHRNELWVQRQNLSEHETSQVAQERDWQALNQAIQRVDGTIREWEDYQKRREEAKKTQNPFANMVQPAKPDPKEQMRKREEILALVQPHIDDEIDVVMHPNSFTIISKTKTARSKGKNVPIEYGYVSKDSTKMQTSYYRLVDRRTPTDDLRRALDQTQKVLVEGGKTRTDQGFAQETSVKLNTGRLPKITGYHPYLGQDGYKYDIEVENNRPIVFGVRDRNDQPIKLDKQTIAGRWGWDPNDFDLDYTREED